MARRGITDVDRVQIDPWPTGNFGRDMEDGRRITRCLSYYREEPSDNGYARPVEGVLATVDAARGVVLEVADYGVVPLAPERGSYLPEHNEPLRDDLRTLEITQPDGVSFTVDGNLLTWQHWTMRVAMTPLEGLVLARRRLGGPRRPARPGPSCTGPPSARWWSPTATRTPCTAGRTPSTSASGDSGAWPTR